MPFYESVFIARQDISAAQAEALGETFANIVKATGGQVAKTEFWGLKTLTYKIKKEPQGPLRSVPARFPACGGGRDGTQYEHQRRCSALHDRTGRSPGGRPIGDDAGAR